MTEENHISTEVKQALTTSKDQIPLEVIQNENGSPLNTPVVEKDIGGASLNNEEQADENWNVWKPKNQGAVSELESDIDYRKEVTHQIENEKEQEPLDAPEQEINEDELYSQSDPQVNEEDFQMPLSQANQTADALLGITNNMLTAGGSFFVKVKKHQEFYEFNEIMDVIDTQNEKNVDRILLDKDDKALLRPLLSQVIRKKAKQLTPEQQLMGAVASIVIKKGQTVMEIRAENKNLENRLIEIIKEQKKQADKDTISTDYKDDFKQSQTPVNDQEFSSDTLDDDDDKNLVVAQNEAIENSIVEYADDSETK
ncbi:hypothetical protein U8527_07160 [Kordia algicida OT-1]|uniref:Uncharacterized protein n=1 Tax=Kordia algicida OT-1 TaxID=391587 RepID=A9EA07_9FLAO|nr:hypothetical protein [Kordia algicida]EDP94723.1 hypothetical protein KAOT1_00565 [Kordia algicida OT-1]